MTNKSYASRAGEKLAFALDKFKVNVENLICADFGSSTGGFVDCLVKNGGRKIYSVDTSYGELAWELRNNPKIEVLERTNAMHVTLPEKVEFISIDTGWTKQEKILPNAVKNLKSNGIIISLIKPQYEFENLENVTKEDVESIATENAKNNGLELCGFVVSPIEGKRAGNTEYLAYFRLTS